MRIRGDVILERIVVEDFRFVYMSGQVNRFRKLPNQIEGLEPNIPWMLVNRVVFEENGGFCTIERIRQRVEHGISIVNAIFIVAFPVWGRFLVA